MTPLLLLTMVATSLAAPQVRYTEGAVLFQPEVEERVVNSLPYHLDHLHHLDHHQEHQDHGHHGHQDHHDHHAAVEHLLNSTCCCSTPTSTTTSSPTYTSTSTRIVNRPPTTCTPSPCCSSFSHLLHQLEEEVEELEEKVGGCRVEVVRVEEEVVAYQSLVSNLQRENQELRRRLEVVGVDGGLIRRQEV